MINLKNYRLGSEIVKHLGFSRNVLSVKHIQEPDKLKLSNTTFYTREAMRLKISDFTWAWDKCTDISNMLPQCYLAFQIGIDCPTMRYRIEKGKIHKKIFGNIEMVDCSEFYQYWDSGYQIYAPTRNDLKRFQDDRLVEIGGFVYVIY